MMAVFFVIAFASEIVGRGVCAVAEVVGRGVGVGVIFIVARRLVLTIVLDYLDYEKTVLGDCY